MQPTSDLARTSTRRVLLLVLIWTVPGLMQFLQEVTYARVHQMDAFQPLHSALMYIPSWYPWIPLSIWIGRLTVRLREAERPASVQMGAHLCALVAAGGAHLALVAWVQTTWPPVHWPLPPFWDWLKQSLWGLQLQGEALAYALVVAITLAWDSQQRAAEERQETMGRALRLERQLAEARLKALQGQLRPHFLFNALHSVQVMMREDLDGAERMLLGMSDLLRSSLRGSDTAMVSVVEEFRQLELYLGIERVRFGDRISVRTEVSQGARGCQIPPWTLQPLAENALRHGLGPLPEGGELVVSARIDGGALVLRVEDDGVGFTDADSVGKGIGLANVRARMGEFFGDAAEVHLAPRSPRGTRVELRLPVRGEEG